ncbi:hypothetical protein ACXZ1K_08775 [Pedobacter sp. PWIIR3]
MKRIYFMVLIWVLFGGSVQAQNTMARLKYEDAEEAYSKSDYALALSKLNEAEGLLKATNPKILYLRIMAQYKIVEQDAMNDYSLLENTRNLIARYLKNYETLPANEEKFRDVYRLSDKLTQYPATRDAFDKKKNEAIKLAADADQEREQKQSDYDNEFDGFIYWPRFELGLTAEQVAQKYPDFKKVNKLTNEYGDIIAKKAGAFYGTVAGFYIKNNITWGYYGTLFRDGSFYDDANFSKAAEESTPILKNLTNRFGFGPEKTVTGSSPNIVEVYTWKKNKKSVILSIGKSTYNGANTSVLYVSSFDERYLR